LGLSRNPLPSPFRETHTAYRRPAGGGPFCGYPRDTATRGPVGGVMRAPGRRAWRTRSWLSQPP
jgi:hypothetical protein